MQHRGAGIPFPHFWTRGTVRETVARHAAGLPAVHVVTINGYNFEGPRAEFKPWTGPAVEVLARQNRGGFEDLEYLDTWPPRSFLDTAPAPRQCPACIQLNQLL